MAPEPLTAERIYRRLKADILDGLFLPGTQLIVQNTADAYGVSISPVRDCAHRLVGERLLELNHGGGFSVPQLSAHALRDLYVWHGYLARHALKAKATGEEDPGPMAMVERGGPHHPTIIRDATAWLFGRIGARPGNQAHLTSILTAGDMLSVARLHEYEVLSNVEGELIGIWKLINAGRDADIREAIWAYHRRRIRRASAIANRISMRGRGRDMPEPA
jgi:hypothetical protein